MKKLTIIASMLVMTVAANAASFTWGFGSDSIMKADGSDYVAGGTAMLFLGTITVDAEKGTADYSKATLLAYGGQNGDYTYGSTVTPITSDLLVSDAAGQAYTLVLVEGNVTSLEEYKGNMIVATGESDRTVDPRSGASWAMMLNNTAFQGNDWQNLEAVPEPTSGLLLLIGMAGLALRRKRA